MGKTCPLRSNETILVTAGQDIPSNKEIIEFFG